jgi:hypothetical protein
MRTHDQNAFHVSKVGAAQSIFSSAQTTTFGCTNQVSIPAQTAVSQSAFQSGAFLDFIVPRTPAGKIQEISLEVKLTNPTANVMTLCPSAFLLDKCEFYFGQSISEQHQGLSLHMKKMYTSTDVQIQTLQTPHNTTVVGSPAFVTISPGESRTMYIDLSVGSFVGLVPVLLKEDLRARVYFEKDSVWSNGTGFHLDNCVMYCEFAILDATELTNIASVYQSGKFNHRYIESRIARTAQILSPSQTYTHQLNNMHGSYIALFHFLQAQSPTVSDLWMTQPGVDTVSLRDPSSQLLLSNSVLTSEYYRYVKAREFASTYLSTNYTTPLIFTEKLMQDWITASHSGSYFLKASGESISFSTKSSVTPNSSHDLVLVGLHVSALRVGADSKVTILR